MNTTNKYRLECIFSYILAVYFRYYKVIKVLLYFRHLYYVLKVIRIYYKIYTIIYEYSIKKKKMRSSTH